MPEQEEFKKYVRELLDAQSYNFLEENMLFSPQTLKKILTQFCDIIAVHLNAESCTINLRMYNGEDMKLLEKDADEKIGKLIREYGTNLDTPKGIFIVYPIVKTEISVI